MGRVIEKGYLNNVNWGPTLQNYADTDPTYPSTPATWRKKYIYDKNDADSANLVGRLYSVVTNNNDDATAEVEEYFAYDKYGNVQSIRQKMLSYSANTCTTRYSYDLLGRLMKIIYPYSANGNVEVNYTYDQVGRITTVTPTTGAAFSTYWYNLKTGDLDTETVNLSGTLKKIFYAHDTTGRLTSITSDRFREGITYRKGGYNNNEDFYHGLIGSDTSTFYSGGPSQQYYRFQYDNFGRLVIAENNLDVMDVGSGNATQYDSNSNIKNIKRGTGSFVTYNYYTGKNRVQNTDGGGNDYVYDETGNLTIPTPRSIQYIKYDPFTQLTMIEKKTSGDSTQLEYGGAKQRVLKSVTVDGQTTKTQYIHGVNDYPIVEKTSSGDERTYVYGPTGLIAVRVNATWYYVLKDHLGSTRVVFNTSGTPQSAYDFDVYGTTKRATENITIPYKFTGQEFDVDMGLYNFRARMYDTTLAAFYATDPAGSTFSPYGYANQNPVSFVDPTGMLIAPWLDPLNPINCHYGQGPRLEGPRYGYDAMFGSDWGMNEGLSVWDWQQFGEINPWTNERVNFLQSGWGMYYGENVIPGAGGFFYRTQTPKRDFSVEYDPMFKKWMPVWKTTSEGNWQMAFFFLNPITVDIWNKYPTEALAGGEAVHRINPTSIKEKHEYVGYTIQNDDGSFSFTQPIKLGEMGGDLPPYTSNVTGWYHTHSDYRIGWTNDDFSWTDQYTSSELIHGNGYLGTPSGWICSFNWHTVGYMTILWCLYDWDWWGIWKRTY